jgi:cell division protein FtsQ
LQSKQIKIGTPIASIPLGSLENEFKQIAWIKNANFYFDNQNILHVKIEQRIPIARIFTQSGNSFYMDAEGIRLPLKQLSVLELPIFTGFTSDAEKLSSPDSALLKDVLTFSQIIQQDSFFNAQIAQIHINPSGQFELVPTIGDQIVLIGSTNHLKDKLNRLYTFYKKILVPSGINAYQYIDCRFDNQVVALKKGLQPIEFGNNVINLNPESKLTDTSQPLPVTNLIPKVDSLKKDSTKLPTKVLKPAVQIANKPLIVKKALVEKSKIQDKKNAKKIPKVLNNKNNKASLNIKKKSAKAVMPKVGSSKTTTNN